ncbi:MAG TPA: MaoC family dehydratase [Stellaceae bacterium]|jgi:acyl dehydratase
MTASPSATTAATQPTRPRFFEDFAPGQVYEFGDRTVTEAEIVEYARQFDPQPFHTDPEAARGSIYGGLIASGWHTAGMMMRMLVDHFIPRESSMGSPGIDELRWLKPVRPGDRLRVRVSVVETKRSMSKPNRGIVRSINEVLNQDGETVLSMRGMGMYRTRDGSKEI